MDDIKETVLDLQDRVYRLEHNMREILSIVQHLAQRAKNHEHAQ